MDKVNVIESFGERKFGIEKWEDKPENFEKRQYEDFNYKLKNGESLNEVMDRELKSLYKILNDFPTKKILIVGHATALTTLFSKWCIIGFDGYRFNGVKFFDGNFDYCETFKLTFSDNNELLNIEHVI